MESKELGTLGVYFEAEAAQKKIKELKEQLKEKDKEIKHLKDCNKSLSNKFDKESDMQNEIDILKYNVEGLEQQLKEKDRQIADLEKQLAGFNKFMEINEWSSIQKMQDTLNSCEQKYFEQQTNLAEKDKEISLLKRVLDNLKGDKASDKLVNVVNAFYEPLLEQKIKQTRHQVCEEIREKLLRLCDWYEDEIGGYWYATEKKINYVLNQIEGEKTNERE